MPVGDRVDDRHRPRQGEFERMQGVRPGEPRFHRVDAAAPPQRPGNGRTIGLVAVVTDAHPDFVGEVDAVEVFEKAVDKMLPRLFAVADDVDAGILLELESEDRRVALGLGERLALRPPRRPELAWFGQPGRLRQAAGDRRLEHRVPPHSP
jgi:hypothetical protein